MSINYQEHLLKTYDAASFKRAEKYSLQNRVTDLEVNGSNIDAYVEGSGSRQYFVNVYSIDGLFYNDCSCPVQDQCKHGITVILEAFHKGLISIGNTEPKAVKQIKTVENSIDNWFEL